MRSARQGHEHLDGIGSPCVSRRMRARGLIEEGSEVKLPFRESGCSKSLMGSSSIGGNPKCQPTSRAHQFALQPPPSSERVMFSSVTILNVFCLRHDFKSSEYVTVDFSNSISPRGQRVT